MLPQRLQAQGLPLRLAKFASTRWPSRTITNSRCVLAELDKAKSKEDKTSKGNTNTGIGGSDLFDKTLSTGTTGLLKTLGQSSSDVAAGSGSEDKAAPASQTPSEDASSTTAVPVPEEPQAPMMHPFDTQKMVMNIKYAGSTRGQAQAITSTIRDMLGEVVNEVNERSVPNSVAANEAYLFEAASSELRNEVQASRYTQVNQMRARLARLQRDVEILQHESGETATLLRADMDMDINERKNEAQTEGNNISLRLQELNSQINVRLASDLKSEIENLRWQITRRGIVAIVFVALSFLYVARNYSRDDSRGAAEPPVETRGAEWTVPMLSPSIAGDDLEDVSVDELDAGDAKNR